MAAVSSGAVESTDPGSPACHRTGCWYLPSAPSCPPSTVTRAKPSTHNTVPAPQDHATTTPHPSPTDRAPPGPAVFETQHKAPGRPSTNTGPGLPGEDGNPHLSGAPVVMALSTPRPPCKVEAVIAPPLQRRKLRHRAVTWLPVWQAGRPPHPTPTGLPHVWCLLPAAGSLRR